MVVFRWDLALFAHNGSHQMRTVGFYDIIKSIELPSVKLKKVWLDKYGALEILDLSNNLLKVQHLSGLDHLMRFLHLSGCNVLSFDLLTALVSLVGYACWICL